VSPEKMARATMICTVHVFSTSWARWARACPPPPMFCGPCGRHSTKHTLSSKGRSASSSSFDCVPKTFPCASSIPARLPEVDPLCSPCPSSAALALARPRRWWGRPWWAAHTLLLSKREVFGHKLFVGHRVGRRRCCDARTGGSRARGRRWSAGTRWLWASDETGEEAEEEDAAVIIAARATAPGRIRKGVAIIMPRCEWPLWQAQAATEPPLTSAAAAKDHSLLLRSIKTHIRRKREKRFYYKNFCR